MPSPQVYLVTGADPVGGAKVLVVSAQLRVVEVRAVRRPGLRVAATVNTVRSKAVLDESLYATATVRAAFVGEFSGLHSVA